MHAYQTVDNNPCPHINPELLLVLLQLQLPVALADHVSRCCKTCGPTKQSPTIPAHTLMLNCFWCLQSIPSAVIYCFRTSVDMDFFFVLVCGTLAQNLFEPLSYILYIYICIYLYDICIELQSKFQNTRNMSYVYISWTTLFWKKNWQIEFNFHVN
jgi:hypothetical protein